MGTSKYSISAWRAGRSRRHTLSASPDSMTITAPVNSRGATKPGMILGTAAYMSPEQARGRKVDKRTDIWSSRLEALSREVDVHGAPT